MTMPSRSPAAAPVQPLEPRRLFAATPVIALHGTTLDVTAAHGVPNTITVGLSADQTQVVATDAYTVGRGSAAVPQSLSRSFAAGTLTLVHIVGSNKADTITIDQTYGSFPIPTQIYGGGGNDTVTGGDEPDAVWGQAGNDVINGGGGNDSLYGMTGSDTLIGGAGDDYLSGGQGRDSLEGDAGNDTLYAPFGPDTLLGGDGTNQFLVHALAKNPHNDYNGAIDTLKSVPVPVVGTSDDGYSAGDILKDVFTYL